MATRVIRSGIVYAVGVGALAGAWYFPAEMSTQNTLSVSIDESFQREEAAAVAELDDLLRLPAHLLPDAEVGKQVAKVIEEPAEQGDQPVENAAPDADSESVAGRGSESGAPAVSLGKPFLASLSGSIAGTEPLTGVHRPASAMKRSSGGAASGSDPSDDSDNTGAGDVADTEAAEQDDTDSGSQAVGDTGSGESDEAPGDLAEAGGSEGNTPDGPDSGADNQSGTETSQSGTEGETGDTGGSTPESQVTDAGQPEQGDETPPVVSNDNSPTGQPDDGTSGQSSGDSEGSSQNPGPVAALGGSGSGEGSGSAAPADQAGQKNDETDAQGGGSDNASDPSLDDPFSVVPPTDIAVLGDEFTQQPTPAPTPAPDNQPGANPPSPLAKTEPASVPEGDDQEPVKVVAVPEPSSLGALLLGMIGLTWLRRRNTR